MTIAKAKTPTIPSASAKYKLKALHAATGLVIRTFSQAAPQA